MSINLDLEGNTDNRPRWQRYAEQQIEQGYRLHFERDTAFWRKLGAWPCEVSLKMALKIARAYPGCVEGPVPAKASPPEPKPKSTNGTTMTETMGTPTRNATKAEPREIILEDRVYGSGELKLLTGLDGRGYQYIFTKVGKGRYRPNEHSVAKVQRRMRKTNPGVVVRLVKGESETEALPEQPTESPQSPQDAREPEPAQDAAPKEIVPEHAEEEPAGESADVITTETVVSGPMELTSTGDGEAKAFTAPVYRIMEHRFIDVCSMDALLDELERREPGALVVREGPLEDLVSTQRALSDARLLEGPESEAGADCEREAYLDAVGHVRATIYEMERTLARYRRTLRRTQRRDLVQRVVGA